MAQRKPEEKVTVDQLLKLVGKLTPEDQGKLRRKLDESWSTEWRALIKEIDEQNQGTPPLSEEEIVAEMKAVRRELKAESDQSGS